MKRLSACLLLAALVPQMAFAWGWLSEPLPPKERLSRLSSSNCIEAILKAEAQYAIPDHLLLALGVQEAGYTGSTGLSIWPWSVNAAGEGRRFQSRLAAETFVKDRLAAGVTSIDVGCLQINLRWHPDAFATLADGFDPWKNVSYAARYLRALYEESGSWEQAAGWYHSRSEGPQRVYLANLRRNHAYVLANLDRLLAGGASSPQEVAPPPPPPREGPLWGAELAGAEGQLRSPYSEQDLQPILPQFSLPEA